MQTMRDIDEFKRCLQEMEKQLNETGKKFSNQEISESAKLASNGILEALNYLDIVRNVIRKTNRVLSEKSRLRHILSKKTLSRKSLTENEESQ